MMWGICEGPIKMEYRNMFIDKANMQSNVDIGLMVFGNWKAKLCMSSPAGVGNYPQTNGLKIIGPTISQIKTFGSLTNFLHVVLCEFRGRLFEDIASLQSNARVTQTSLYFLLLFNGVAIFAGRATTTQIP